MDESDRHRSYPLTSAGEPKAIRAGGLDRYTVFFRSQSLRHVLPHLGGMGAQTRRLRDNRRIHVRDAEPRFSKRGCDGTEDVQAGCVGPALVGREQPTEITQSAGAEQGIPDGVTQYIRIRMTRQTVVVSDQNPAKDEWTVFGKGMRVEALSNLHDLRTLANSPASRRSSGEVTLMFIPKSGTTATLPP